MAIRIKVFPNQFAGGRLGGYGAVSVASHLNSKLQAQKQISGLQIQYERALANERIERARLEERMKNPYAWTGAAMGAFPAFSTASPYMSSMLGNSMLGTGFLPGFGVPRLY